MHAVCGGRHQKRSNTVAGSDNLTTDVEALRQKYAVRVSIESYMMSTTDYSNLK